MILVAIVAEMLEEYTQILTRVLVPCFVMLHFQGVLDFLFLDVYLTLTSSSNLPLLGFNHASLILILFLSNWSLGTWVCCNRMKL
ncbi:hypothetical protein MKW92_012741 [Papaver armeniacum]|nr:hypothetical protein MKW92_012741 [Papaver armeniacum]